VKFHDSSLIRILADLCLVEAAESKPVFAERLAQWLDLSDAITLHAAHNASAASSPAAQSGVPSVAGIAVEEEYARVRTDLVDSITKSCSPNMGEARIRWPTPKPGVGIEVAPPTSRIVDSMLPIKAPWNLRVRPLRTSVRQALSRASTALKQLAALDEALDKIWCVRERQLLSTVPLLLEKRFEQLLKAHHTAARRHSAG
jgi:hypothetical protein